MNEKFLDLKPLKHRETLLLAELKRGKICGGSTIYLRKLRNVASQEANFVCAINISYATKQGIIYRNILLLAVLNIYYYYEGGN